MIPVVVAALMGTAMATTAPAPDACAQGCIDKWLACKTAPGANMSGCASDFASCVGYNPFTGSDFTTPVHCSTNGASVVTKTTMQTITSCVDQKCTNPQPTPDACITTCNAKWDTCKKAPGANMASCSAQYAQCIGFNPFTGTGDKFTTPAACQTATVPTSAPAPTQSACITTCNAKWDACKKAPGANMASCSAQYAQCIGFNPFTGTGDKFTTPVACQTATVPTNAPALTQNACITTCNAKWNACKTAPGANMASCSSEYARCIGFNPFTGTGNTFATPTACQTTTGPSKAPMVTAAAGHLEPAVILAALGAAALL